MLINRKEVQVRTEDGLMLKAVLTSPKTPQAAVLLISGGGNVGAQGDVSSPFIGSGYKGQSAPLNEQLAQMLLKVDVATLRFDKRGYEDPTMVSTQTLPLFTSDARAALRLLRETTPEVPLLLLGFSEGALIAIQLAAEEDVDGVFLLAPPTRPYPEALRYQFVDWPLGVVRTMDPQNKGFVTKAALFSADIPFLPLGDLKGVLAQFGIEVPSLECDQLPFDDQGKFPLASLEALYEASLGKVTALLDAPFMKALYQSYLALPSFEKMTQAVTAPAFVYVGLKDSQISPDWMIEDSKQLRSLQSLRTYQDLGHCFAPLQGMIGQIKTSGPFSPELLQHIAADVTTLISKEH